MGLAAEALIFGVTVGLMAVLHKAYRSAFREVARRRGGDFRQTILLEPVIEVATPWGRVTVDLRSDAASYREARSGGHRRWTRFRLRLADARPARSLDLTLDPASASGGAAEGVTGDGQLALAALATLSPGGVRVRVLPDAKPPVAEALVRGWIGDAAPLDAAVEEAARELARLVEGLRATT
jgi:hypothetical protein